MTRVGTLLVVAVVLAGVGGIAVGYLVHPAATVETHIMPQTVSLTGYGLSCGPASQSPYLQGVLQFNLTSTFWMDAIASVAYLGNWTGDTNQLVHTNTTKHVAVTWGPGAMQSIYVTSCPVVGVTIWRIVETLKACPNPPCDDGTNPAP